MDRAAGRSTVMIMAILSSSSIASLMKEDNNYNKGCQSHSSCHGDLEREREREKEGERASTLVQSKAYI
jgi:hypothetical protein